jgi:hypothetical protein
MLLVQQGGDPSFMSHSTPFPLLRTYLSRAYRKSRFLLLNYSLSLAGLALTIIGASAQSILPTVLGVAIIVAGILGTIITWYRSVRDLRFRRLDDDDYMTRPKPLAIAPRLRDSGYEVLPRRGHPSDALLTSSDINKALLSGQNPNLITRGKTYHAGLQAAVAQVLLKEFTSRSGTVVFNAKKVRLESEPLLDGGRALAAIHVQPTRYFDTLITNNSLSFALWSRRSHSDAFNGHEFCFPGRVIPECSESSCANQVGASTLAVTSDGYLVITEQGRQGLIAPGQLASSGSGSADWPDTQGCTDLQAFVKNFAGRELAEECGLKREDIEWLKIIGYGRFLYRGGLPQFFCLAKLRCEFSSIHVTRPEQPLTSRHLPVYCGGYPLHGDAIRKDVVKLAKTAATITPPLWWNLTLLSHIQENDL